MMGAYWYLACDSLSRSATILADDFQQVFRFSSTKPSIFNFIHLCLGSASHWSGCNGSRLSCTLASPEQTMPRYGNGNIHHIYISQFVFVLHDYDFHLWFDVTAFGGVRFEGYWTDGECFLQHLLAILHLWRGSLCVATRANQFSKEIAHGRIELDELRRSNWNQHVFASHRNESIKHQLRRFLRCQSKSFQIGEFWAVLKNDKIIFRIFNCSEN